MEDKKQLILINLNKLKDMYSNNPDKKWNLRALQLAIGKIEKYEKIIISGDQLKKDIKGIGEKISKRINEILETGILKELNENKINNNMELENLLLITGVGTVTAKKWNKLGLNCIEDVKKAIMDKKITTTHHIDIGIKYYDDFQKKIPKLEIDKIKNLIFNILKEMDDKIIFDICGSYRRGNLCSGDIDILISHPNYFENIKSIHLLEKIVKQLINKKIIIDNLTSNGETKFMGVCKIEEDARRIDIRVVDYKNYYSSLLYFTGSKNFNLYIRNKALESNYSLNEYALTDLNNNSQIYLNNEEDIFKILKIPYLKPEERNM